MSRADIEDALQAWVVTATGYPADHVIWKNQDAPRPTDAFIELQMGNWETLGAFDEETEDVDTTRPAGQETAITIQGWREFTLSVECYSRDETGNASAPAVLTAIQTHLGLPSVRYALAAANVTPSFQRGTVRNVPELLGTSRFESRAILEVNFYTVDTAVEYTTYIETVELTGDIQGTVDPTTGAVDVTITS